MDKWIFVIDTDSYAGNFERDMCAYVTGVIGECEVGDDFAELYRKETKEVESRFQELLEQRSDDHGHYRPCSLWETKGWLFDGKHGAVKEEDFDQEDANKKYRTETAKYYQDHYKRTSKINVNEDRYKAAGWTENAKTKELDSLQKDIDRCLSEKTICPRTRPNNSVAIFFQNKPTAGMIDFMKERSAIFAEAKRRGGESWDKNFKLKIYGYRLIKETTALQEVDAFDAI